MYAYDAPGSNFPINLHDEEWRGEECHEREKERKRQMRQWIHKVKRDERWEDDSVKTRSDNVGEPSITSQDASILFVASAINLNNRVTM